MSYKFHKWSHAANNQYAATLNVAWLLTNSISWVFCSQRLPHRAHAAVFLSKRISRAPLFGIREVKPVSLWRLLNHCTTQGSANDCDRHRWTHDDNSWGEGGVRRLADHERIESFRKVEAKFTYCRFYWMCVKCKQTADLVRIKLVWLV